MLTVPALQVTVAGNSPHAREGHAACIISHFLLISSGVHSSSSGSQRRLADTHILDLAAPCWECLDDGAWAASLSVKHMLAHYCVFHGNRLYMLKPSKYTPLLHVALPQKTQQLGSTMLTAMAASMHSTSLYHTC